MKTITTIFAITILLGAMTTIRAQQYNNWVIAANGNSQVTTMTVENPATNLLIEKQLILNVGRQGEITSGTVIFKNGFQRTMEKQEAATYFETLGGQRALWSYWQTHDMLSVLKTGQTIPSDWFGKKTLIIMPAGVEVVGMLAAGGATGEADQASIIAENASGGPIFFSMKAISQLKQIR